MNQSTFYDNYISTQARSGINDRIYLLYKRLLKLGLNNNSSVLEIGCGIGTLTYLIAQKVKKGKIEAMDISPASIDFANKYLQQENLVLYSGDIIKKEPRLPYYDYILLFDVIEHIPVEDHLQLFSLVASKMTETSFLLINIPNPGYIMFDQKYNSAVLQELDQPIGTGDLINDLVSSNLELVFFGMYSVWVKDDYQFIIVRKRTEFKEQLLSENRGLAKKAKIWLWRKWRQFRFPYPPKGSF